MPKRNALTNRNRKQRRAEMTQCLQDLTGNDREEVLKFQRYLRDVPVLSFNQLWDKYGESYLGPKPGAINE